MAKTELVHCIYTSSPVEGIDRSELDTILAEARANNRRLGVSGMLLFDDGSFFQVLEGPREVVEPLFDKIKQDERHQHVVRLVKESIEERDFANWTMGIADVPKDELATIPGLNDFFADGGSFASLDSGKAKDLLGAFKGGRWRNSLS